MTAISVQYYAALFQSVSHVIHAERILKEARIPHKLIPVPKVISSDCGVCIRFLPDHIDIIRNTLTGKAEHFEIRPL